MDLLTRKDYFFVLGAPLENGLSKRNIHIWKKEENLWMNKDHEIYPHNPSIEYVTKFILEDQGNIYIVGGYRKGLFLWSWDLEELHTGVKEVLIDNIDINRIDDAFIKDGVLTVDIDNKIVKYSINGDIERNYIAEELENIDGFLERKEKLYLLDDGNLYVYKTPKHTNNDTFNFQVSKGNMNIIDILIDGHDDMGVRLINKNKLITTESSKMIKVSEGRVYLRAHDDASKDLALVITSPGESKITKVTFMYDRIVYKGDV